jgi:hypothetical protein
MWQLGRFGRISTVSAGCRVFHPVLSKSLLVTGDRQLEAAGEAGYGGNPFPLVSSLNGISARPRTNGMAVSATGTPMVP